jgi:hypothetical protein
MTSPTPYQCVLEVMVGGKGIPYGKSQRSDGSFNYGFLPLKGRVEQVSEITETHDDPALGDFLRLVNDNSTGFFTVGCVSGKVEDESGHRMSGYVEVSFNDRQLVGDACNYFKVFWKFVRSLQAQNFGERVQVCWEIIGATFLDAKCDGVTARIVVNTHYMPESAAAYECWKKTLAALSIVFVESRVGARDGIY